MSQKMAPDEDLNNPQFIIIGPHTIKITDYTAPKTIEAVQVSLDTITWKQYDYS